MGHVDTALNRPIQQLDELGLLGHDVCRQLTGELAVHDLQAVSEAKVDARGGHDLVGDLVKAAAYHADLPALAVCRAHKLQRAGGKRHALKGALEYALIQAGKQPHAFLERLLKVELAAHGALGDLRYLLAHAGLLAQQVDDLLVDERGVDIHNDEACGHDGPFRVRLYWGTLSHAARLGDGQAASIVSSPSSLWARATFSRHIDAGAIR